MRATAGAGSPRRAVVMAVALVVLVAALAGTLWYTRYRGSALDRFYRPPFPFAGAAPGTVVKADPTGSGDIHGSVTRIMYHSRSLTGKDIAVTGYLAVPPGRAPAGGRPIATIAHPTVGIADRCAPSRSPSDSAATVNQLLARGWVVVATDYEGLGPPGRHPYLVGTSEGRSVLDGARAARRILGRGASDQVLVWGHSQGGHAALWTRGIAHSYAPDLDVVGVVAVAPVSNVADFITATAFNAPTITLMAVAGYAAAYPDLKTDEVLTALGSERLGAVDHYCQDDIRKHLHGASVGELRGLDPSDVPGWTQRIAANHAAEARSDIPVLLLQGGADPIIPASATGKLFARMCQDRQPVTLVVIPGATHGSVVDVTRSRVDSWAADRLAGKPAGTSCNP